MANIRSAKKRARQTLKRNLRNKALRSQYKTYVSKAEKTIGSGDIDQAEEAVRQAISVLDKTARKRVIHPNNAARRKSNLVKKLSAARATE